MIVFDITCYAGCDFAAKSKLSSNFTIIQTDSESQLRSVAIMETDSETKSWLHSNIPISIHDILFFLSSMLLQKLRSNAH